MQQDEFERALEAAGSESTQVIDLIARRVSDVVGGAAVLALLSDGGRTLTPVAAYHPDREVRDFMRALLGSVPFEVGKSVAGSVVVTGEPVLLNDLTPDLTDYLVSRVSREFTKRYPVTALLIVPIRDGREILGSLGVVSTTSGHAYTSDDVRALEALAERASGALAASRIEPRVLAGPEYEAIFRHSFDGVLFTAPDGRIFAANPAACRILEMSEATICGLGRAGILVGDDARTIAALEERRRVGHVHAELPMRRGNGEVFVADLSSTVFESEGEQRTIVVFRDVSDRVAQRDRALKDAREFERKATTDELTGLPNRRGFLLTAQQALAFAERDAKDVVLLFIDVDSFKGLNDRYGHAAGDRVLVLLGEVIRREVRGIDAAARLGGDEFVVLLFGATLDDASRVIERIRKDLEARCAPLPVRLSVGKAHRSSGAETTLDVLLKAADADMYRDKTRTTNRSAEES